MRVMGLEAIYQKPNTSQGHPDHKVYPSLIPSFQMTSKSPLNDRHFDTVSAKRAIRGNSL